MISIETKLEEILTQAALAEESAPEPGEYFAHGFAGYLESALGTAVLAEEGLRPPAEPTPDRRGGLSARKAGRRLSDLGHPGACRI